MPAKKTTKKKIKTHLDIGSDPPVLVGGGGSAYLWIRLDQAERPVNPQSNNPGTGIKPGAPTPSTRASYTCSRVIGAPPQLFFNDGVNPEKPLDIQDINEWYIRFA